MDELVKTIRRAVERAVAECPVPAGCDRLEFHGEVRGVVQEGGRPETAIGVGVAIGQGGPAGWPQHVTEG